MASDPAQRARLGLHYYEMQELGLNYRITDIQCALGASQLDRLASYIAKRQEVAATYRAAFKELEPCVECVPDAEGTTN